MNRYSQRFLTKPGGKRFQYCQIVYTLKMHYSVKIGSISFFIFWHAKIPSSFKMPRYWYEFLTYLFLSALRFSNLICQAKNLPRITISGSSSSKWLPGFILIRSTLRVPRKCNITRFLIKIEYIIICLQSSKKFFKPFTSNKPMRNKFQCCLAIITSFITRSLSFIFIRAKYWNTGLVPSVASLTSWGEGASLTLVGHPSSDGIRIKMPYGVDVLHWPASHPIFSYWVG